MAEPSIEIFRPLPLPDRRRRGPVSLPAVETRLTRTNYFDGRLLTAADLTRDQEYLDRRLRDVGRAGGHGVVEGLDVTLDGSRLSVSAGVGVTPSGRVIVLEREAERPLVADLLDAGAIGAANGGRAPEFGDGLYAVVLGHLEVESGIAEAFPRDLGAERRPQIDRIADMLQLQLVPLPVAVPTGAELRARATLAGPLLLSRAFDSVLPSEAVCLGVLATRLGEPVWFDPLLLRRRRVADPTRGTAIEDLVRHHLALYAELRRERPRGDFVASEHFAVLPPVGRAPREAVDPGASTQRFFPPQVEVFVAPVRNDELEAIARESLELTPLDLSREDPAEIVVLAPLSPSDFANLAPALTRDAATPRAVPLRLFGPSRLRRLFGPGELAVGLPAVSTAVGSESDIAVWRRIWERVADIDLPYVMRPPHAAPSGLSVARAATGMAGPPGEEPEPPPAQPPIREDVDEFLRRLDRILAPAWGTGGTDFLDARARETRLRQLEAFLARAGGGRDTGGTGGIGGTGGTGGAGGTGGVGGIGGGRVISVEDLRLGLERIGRDPEVDPRAVERILAESATTTPRADTPVVSETELRGAVERLSAGGTAVNRRELDAVVDRSTFRAPAGGGRVIPKRAAPKRAVPKAAAPKAAAPKRAVPKRPPRKPRGGG